MAIAEQLAIDGGPKTVPSEMHRGWPEITEDDRRAVLSVLERGELCGPHAPEISALERDWASYTGSEFCIATNTGTAALHCCIAGVGVQPGDEVIVPALSFIATAAAVAHQGATPVFCDVDSRTFNLDPARLEERITERTTAVMPVHIHGLPADMDAINAVAGRHELAVIEDAAQSHGAAYKGKLTGKLGDCAGFSLNATKNLSGGEGGLLVTDDADIFKAARRLAIFGEDVPPLGPDEFRSYIAYGLGWNYRNQELSAAFARSQLLRLDRYNETAQHNAAVLSAGIAEIPGLSPPYVPSDRTSVFHKYRVLINTSELGYTGRPAELRDRLVRALRAEGVEAVIWQTLPLPAYPAFRTQKYLPWRASGSGEETPRPWDPAEYPVASGILDSSIVIGAERRPLYVQDQSLMKRYVEAIRKVIDNLEAVLSKPFEPLALR